MSNLNSDVNSSVIDVDNYCQKYSIPNEQFKTADDILASKKYQLGKQIGSGGYGTVYLIEKTDSHQVLACKMIDMTESIRKHFKNELVVMFTCNQHPNIISMLDQFVINDKAYIIMEYADGGTLSELTAKKPLSEKVAKMFFMQIVKGIIYLHRNRIAHRDLKLDNLLLVKSERHSIVKITDFGLSIAVYHARKGYIESGNFAGTRPYMAPEIIRIRVHRDFRGEFSFEYNPFIADIWALGVCLYEMLASYLPFNVNDDEKLLSLQENREYNYPSNLSHQCKDIIGKMLDPIPESRADPFSIEHHAWLKDENNA